MTTSTWKTHPSGGDWNNADNWTPAVVPADTAVFSTSSQTAITFSEKVGAAVACVEFSENAPSYTFLFGPAATPALAITGTGIINHSRKQQSLVVAAYSSGHENPQLKFLNSATAGGDDMYYCAGPVTEQSHGGGVISFCNQANAGSAAFKVWTGAATPPKHSTVGGEVSFSDSTSAGTARFTIYGTLGSDGDTFGNVVFHDAATAANATFTNIGGTVSGGDGGNTQFYISSTAANGTFYNLGGTHSKANGGDVAFDGTSNGGNGYFYNYAAKAADAYGGVTSFNNNWPDVSTQGASAGDGRYFNYGAREGEQGGGGHIEFSAKFGSPTAAKATFNNYGSVIEDKSSAGHTIFSISLPNNHSYYPDAGDATFWNHPGQCESGAAGFTEFAVYTSENSTSDNAANNTKASNYPTAGNATIINLGGNAPGTAGGYTVFSGKSRAENATLIAYGGTNGGYGGRVVFYDEASGDTSRVQLFGNGELDISNHAKGVSIAELGVNGGIITIELGSAVTALTVKEALRFKSSQTSFHFRKSEKGDFSFNTRYTILTSAKLADIKQEQFIGNSIDGVEPSFSIAGNALQVEFLQE